MSVWRRPIRTTAEAQRDLSLSYEKLGNVQLKLGDTVSALEFYQQSLDISERLAAADPSNSQAQRDLMVSHYKLAEVAAALLEYDTAVERYTTAIAVLDRMIANGQNVEQSQQERAALANALRTVERAAPKARVTLADWDTFISHPTARWRLSLRIRHLARTNRFDEIPQTAAMLRSLYVENPTNLYNAACGYAVCAGAIQAAEGESLTADQQTRGRTTSTWPSPASANQSLPAGVTSSICSKTPIWPSSMACRSSNS